MVELDIVGHVITSFEPTADLRALNETNMQAAYQSVLHGKEVLLYLDNARSAEQIAKLTPPDTCAMLITSRWTFTVPGLQSRRVDVMSENDAKNFLLELCPRIGKKDADLAKASACLPLALRISGSFLQVNNGWSIEKYLASLNDHKQRLATLKASREEAELTAEHDPLATFELSYNALAVEDQKHWRMLGVFPAPFDAGAAQAMWELEEEDTTKLLGLFGRYSLLEFDETSSRYNLHDLLADYALSQTDEQEEQGTRLKHASHYKEVLSTADDLYLEGGEKVLQGLRLFDMEWEHARFAQFWLAGNIEKSNVIAELAMLYSEASAYCLDLRLPPKQKIEWLNLGVEAARKLGNRGYEGIHLGNLGLAYADLGDARKAIEFYEQALLIDREIGDRRGEGADLGNLGLAYADLGDARKAIEFYELRMVIAREIGDRRGEGNALFNMGLSLYKLEEKERAIELVRQALKIYEAIESPTAEKARDELKEWGAEE